MATAKRKPTTPLTRCDGTMSESQFLQWIRSALRSKSLRWPPRTNALHAARKPYKGPNKLQKWVFTCALCNDDFKAKEIAVDHAPVPAGSILSVSDIGPFCENLYCDSSNLRVLCHPCHAIHTLAEKNGITFEEAKVEKAINEILKQPVKKVLAWLAERGHTSSTETSNATKRKQLVTSILKSAQTKEN